MTTWLYLLLAFVVGIGLSLQVGVNAQLSEWIGDPIRASLVSFAVGTLALGLASLVVAKPWPALAHLGQAPWWVWTGGVLGAVYVASSVVAAPRLGAAVLVALVVAGQSLASVVLDHFGWVGFPEHAVTPGRIVGVILLVVGVVLVRVF